MANQHVRCPTVRALESMMHDKVEVQSAALKMVVNKICGHWPKLTYPTPIGFTRRLLKTPGWWFEPL